MQSINDFVARTPGQSPYGDYAVWTFRVMLEALAATFLDTHGSVDSETVAAFESKFGDRLKLRSMFNIPHDSDESCSADVLALDGMAVMLLLQVGDESDYHDGLRVLDAPVAKQLLQLLIELQSREAFEKLDKAHADDQDIDINEALRQSRYLTPLSPGAFAVANPRWALGLTREVRDGYVWHRASGGEAVRVRNFVRWVSASANYDSGESVRNRAVVATDSEPELVLDARDLIVTVLDDKQAAQAAADAIGAPSHWCAVAFPTLLRAGPAMAHVRQYSTGTAVLKSCSVVLPTPERAKAFALEFAEPQPGVFELGCPQLLRHGWTPEPGNAS